MSYDLMSYNGSAAQHSHAAPCHRYHVNVASQNAGRQGNIIILLSINLGQSPSGLIVFEASE